MATVTGILRLDDSAWGVKPMQRRDILLWDLPVRLFHWLLVIAVVGAIVTVKLGGNWMVWHERFGLSVLGLVVFRVLWGFAGGFHARFIHFFPTPGRIRAYLQGQWQAVGHNPLGALSVFAMLGVLGVQALTGLFANDDIAFEGPLRRAVSSDLSSLLTTWHHRIELVIFALVLLHVVAILFYVFVRRDNLVRPMLTGRKAVDTNQPVPESRSHWLAFLICIALTAGVLWMAQGGLLSPQPPPPPDLGW